MIKLLKIESCWFCLLFKVIFIFSSFEEDLFGSIDAEIASGANTIILSDRGMNHAHAPIPALLAVAGTHHHLIRKGTRTRVSLIVESGEPREVHHLAVLLGYGANAIRSNYIYALLSKKSSFLFAFC